MGTDGISNNKPIIKPTAAKQAELAKEFKDINSFGNDAISGSSVALTFECFSFYISTKIPLIISKSSWGSASSKSPLAALIVTFIPVTAIINPTSKAKIVSIMLKPVIFTIKSPTSTAIEESTSVFKCSASAVMAIEFVFCPILKRYVLTKIFTITETAITIMPHNGSNSNG